VNFRIYLVKLTDAATFCSRSERHQRSAALQNYGLVSVFVCLENSSDEGVVMNATNSSYFFRKTHERMKYSDGNARGSLTVIFKEVMRTQR
jgi:hypothetical protein